MADSAGVQPQYIEYEVRGAVTWIFLARPNVGNAQNYRLLGQLDDAFKRAVEDDDVRVVELTTGNLVGGLGAKEMASANKKAAGEG